jgi:hypothetical protein
MHVCILVRRERNKTENDIAMFCEFALTSLFFYQQTVLQTSPDDMMADFGVDNPLSAIVSCAICLGDYAHGEAIQGSKNCVHVFHSECIMDWLVKHQECPICRTDFGDVEAEAQESAPDLATPDLATSTTTSTTIPA